MKRREAAAPQGEAATETIRDDSHRQDTAPARVFEVRPLRAMDLAHLPAIRTASYWDALVAAGRMSDLGAPCIVWVRRAEVAA